MKTINVPFDKEEYDALVEMKGEMSWHELIYRSRWFVGILNRKSQTEFGKNWEIDPPIEIEKPCHLTGYCPYGQLVEAFPLHEEESKKALELGWTVVENGETYPDLNRYIREYGVSKKSCEVFGHECPAFYCAEPLGEDVDDGDVDAEEED